MSRIEIQQNTELERVLTLEEMIISKSMNGWVLQLFNQMFSKKKVNNFSSN